MQEKQMEQLAVSEETRERMESIRLANLQDQRFGAKISWKVEMQKEEHMWGKQSELSFRLQFEISFQEAGGDRVTMICD